MPNFKEDLDRLLHDPQSFGRRDCLFVSDTPSCMVMLGMRQLPIFITRKHARDIMHEKSPENRHWHGLGKEELLAIPNLLTAPAVILDALDSASRKDAVVSVLAETDADMLPLVAVIRPDGESSYECEIMPSNHLLSVYGREDIAGYLREAVEEDKVLFIDEEKTKDLQSQAQLDLLRELEGLPFNTIVHPSQVVMSLVAPNERNGDRRKSARSLSSEAELASSADFERAAEALADLPEPEASCIPLSVDMLPEGLR